MALGEKRLPDVFKDVRSSVGREPVIQNQTPADAQLVRQVPLGDVFQMSDGGRYIFDRHGTVHKLCSQCRRKKT